MILKLINFDDLQNFYLQTLSRMRCKIVSKVSPIIFKINKLTQIK